jgi:uncharacterized linocin/CFP29 family protein
MEEHATVVSGREFGAGASGRWAGERFRAAIQEGKSLSPGVLRTNDTLRRYEWIAYDTAIIMEAQIRLRAVADLIAMGLTQTITNGLAKTLFEYEKISDVDPATVSLDGITRSENDRVEFTPGNLPLPITHKDWFLNLRSLLASREKGEPLDTTHARLAGRKVAEETERMLFQGGKQFAGFPIYGYTTFPGRNTASFGTNGNWANAAKTGADIVADVQTMMALLEGDRMYGPYMIYTSANSSLKLQDDYKANSDRTIRERILALDNVLGIRVVDQLPANNVITVQMTSDVVELLIGEDLQNIQWDTHGGFKINFKAFQIMIPLLRTDAGGRSGIAHMS